MFCKSGADHADFCNRHGDFASVVVAIFILKHQCPDVVEDLFSQGDSQALDVEDMAVFDKFAVVKDCCDKADDVCDRLIVFACC